jgi:GcrA cell cycle regulator
MTDLIPPRPYWTAPHDAALRAHFAGRMSFSRIAAAINGEFHTGYSRNAVVGRAKRIGLRGEPKPVRVKPRPVPKPVHTPAPAPVTLSAAAIALRCAEIAPRHIALTDLAPADCRYPYGEAVPFTFCGHPKLADSSYCAPHFWLCHR